MESTTVTYHTPAPPHKLHQRASMHCCAVKSTETKPSFSLPLSVIEIWTGKFVPVRSEQ